jgi:hypothetical protein
MSSYILIEEENNQDNTGKSNEIIIEENEINQMNQIGKTISSMAPTTVQENNQELAIQNLLSDIVTDISLSSHTTTTAESVMTDILDVMENFTGLV